jgi:hypothetical protein
MNISNQNAGLVAIKRMSTQSGRVGHQEMVELTPGKEPGHSLTARRGECLKSADPEKGKVVEGDAVSRDRNRILPTKKTKCNSKAFTINNDSGHMGITPDKKNSSHEKMDCVIYGSGLVTKKATGRALASNCDIFACKSTHDSTTKSLCQFMWHKWVAFCIYNMCLVTFCAAYLTLSRCKKRVIASINTFIGCTGAVMSTNVFETNKYIANSFTAANFTAIEHTTIRIISSFSDLLASHAISVKFQRKRFVKRSSTTIMLAVTLIVSIVAGSQAQQVSLQF